MPLQIKKGVGWWLAGDIFSNKVVERVIVVVLVIIVVQNRRVMNAKRQRRGDG